MLILYHAALKDHRLYFPLLSVSLIATSFAASLMWVQIHLGHIICWPCFASELGFYITFFVIALEVYNNGFNLISRPPDPDIQNVTQEMH